MATPALHVARAWLRDGSGEVPLPEGVVDDASHLESTHVREVVAIEGTTDEAIERIRTALARSEGAPLSIEGARHTMGGHTIAPGGVVLDLGGVRSLALDGDVLIAGAGSCWRHVIEFLAPRGRAVEVMQSNADFSIGGSLGANCHGWQPDRGPLVSTLDSFTMVLADGRAVRASRSENADLFAHAVGGYSLFGVMVEARLRTVPDAMCEAQHTIASLDDLDATLRGGLSDDTELAFARLSIVPGSDRFETALVTAYRRVEGVCPALCPPEDHDLTRLVFRGQVGSDFGRRLRWLGERAVGGESGARASRNQLMSEPVRRFANRRRDSTDILFEGFVPPEAAVSYARAIRRIVAAHDVDLPNVTVRHVLADDVTVLRYAASEVLGFVMLIAEPRSAVADARLAVATREMIDAVHDHGGRYYLPYRNHASRDQFHRAYPEAIGFAETKRRFDPQLRFQNRFWSRYLG